VRGGTDAGAQFAEISRVVASAVPQGDEAQDRTAALCQSALLAGGLAADLFTASADDKAGRRIRAPLRDRMILTGNGSSEDAAGRAVCALGWYYPLRLTARAPDREHWDVLRDVLPWLSMLHRGLHPIESLVVVTDEETIVDLYERVPDSTRFAIGMARWLAIHLGDKTPELPGPPELVLLAGSLSQGWRLFAAALDADCAG